MARQSCAGITVNKNSVGQQVRMVLAALMLCAGAATPAEPAWPTVSVPPGVASFAMGGEAVVNGLPLRMRGVLSAETPAQVAAMFRTSLGQPLVENTRGATRVLGRALGEFYATVQLEPAGTGTRGVVAVTRLGAAQRDSGQRTLTNFPAGTKLISQVSSVDGTRHADFLTLSNGLDVAYNIGYVKHALDAEGYTLERATSPAGHGNAAPPTAREGTSMLFKRGGAEVVAVIFRDGAGTAIVLNTVTELERTK